MQRIKETQNHTFPTFLNPDSNILILGSFPSVKSREYGFYYMNKNNRFWDVLSNIYNCDFNNRDINIKKELLTKYHIALSDVIESCKISGSSDASISDIKLMDIDGIINNSNIKKIYCNGKTSFNLFMKYFYKYKEFVTLLPSTSSANAKFRLDDLINEWRIINE